MEGQMLIDLSAVLAFMALAIVGWRYLSMRYTIWIITTSCVYAEWFSDSKRRSAFRRPALCAGNVSLAL